MRPYSQDLRDRILRALERRESPTKIARQFEVSRGWVYRVRSQWVKDGRRTGLRIGGYRRSCLAEVESTLRAWIADETDLTLAEVCARLAEKEGIHIKVPALWHQLKKWGLVPRKKPASS
jgi:transposase